jgi:hypothetical protein
MTAAETIGAVLIVILIVAALVGVSPFWRADEPDKDLITGKGHSRLFTLLFWIHQAVFGAPSFFYGADIIINGKTDGILNVIGLFLAWIGGTLTWGIAALIHRHLRFSLPSAYRVPVQQPPPSMAEERTSHAGNV